MLVIAIGSVIKGETQHFDFVCDGVTQGIKDLNVLHDVPVIFCVLTDNNLQQSIDDLVELMETKEWRLRSLQLRWRI